MIDILVKYLHAASVPFRLSSYPSAEPEPIAASALGERAVLVDGRVVLVDGRAVIACYPAGESPDLAALGSVLGGAAIEGDNTELPDEFQRQLGPVPPLGGLFGLPVVLDEGAAGGAVIAFRAFGESDWFEIPYDDYARLEQPRIASFASAGALPAHRRAGRGAAPPPR